MNTYTVLFLREPPYVVQFPKFERAGPTNLLRASTRSSRDRLEATRFYLIDARRVCPPRRRCNFSDHHAVHTYRFAYLFSEHVLSAVQSVP